MLESISPSLTSGSHFALDEADSRHLAKAAVSHQWGHVRRRHRDRKWSYGPGLRHRGTESGLQSRLHRQGLPGELTFQLPGQHDFLYHSGTVGDWRHTVYHCESQTESTGSPRVLSKG